MPKIKCELYCRTNSISLSTIYTGFHLLEKQGKIELNYQIGKNQFDHLFDRHFPVSYLLVKVNDAKLVIFDTGDYGSIDQKCLSQIDFQFKRSFSAQLIGSELAYKKVFPLGLLFPVYEKYPNRFSLKRILIEKPAAQMVKSFIKAVLGRFTSIHPRLYRLNNENCYTKPDLTLPAGVIFMARLWDPSKTVGQKKEETESINTMRVDCIRKLRREFGARYMGGLAHDEYSSHYFADCLIENTRLSDFGNYMRLLQQYPIGVATTGLHNSTGWKFAEYMAFSRAIVAEKLHFESQGLEAGKHYLEFKTSDECVEAVAILMDNKELRAEMMNRNHEYYQAYISPDRLVWNALSTVLEHCEVSGHVDPISDTLLRKCQVAR